ncbi:hypothetical protein D3C87_1320670 [compost metagenome]
MRIEDTAHALELVRGQDGGALQRLLQLHAVDRERVLVALGDHALEVRELALHQLADQFDVRERELDLVGGQLHLHGIVVVFEQPLQFQDGLARDDHFLPRAAAGGLGLEFHAAVRQAVPVGGHGHHLLAIHHEQHAVQVIADVLLRHGEVDHRQQVLERLLRQAHARVELRGFGHGREFLGGQRLEREAALARLHRHALVVQRQRHVAVRHRAQDVQQLARRHGSGHAVAANAAFGVGGDLDLDVRREEGNVRAGLANQQVGQDREGVAALHDAAHDLQRTQQIVSRGFDQLH